MRYYLTKIKEGQEVLYRGDIGKSGYPLYTADREKATSFKTYDEALAYATPIKELQWWRVAKR